VHPILGLSARLMRLAARTLLLSLSVATLGPVLHGVHDDRCDEPLVAHGAGQHYMQAAGADATRASGEDHCVACHFARASRGPAAWEPTGLTVLVDGVLLYHSDGQLVAAPFATPRPARAPPLL
jgi:hypothetical protein